MTELVRGLLGAFDSFWSLLGEALLPLATLLLAAAAIRLYLRTRNGVFFEAWVNQSGLTEFDVGGSLASQLLFRVRAIQHVHSRSVRHVGLWNPYSTLPAFRQDLDHDVKLLSPPELGKYGGPVSHLVLILFRVIPYLRSPATLKGAIHAHGKSLLLQVTLENYRSPMVWEVRAATDAPEELPGSLDELAYRIYLGLADTDLFTSAEAFRAYTEGVSAYLQFMELGLAEDLELAERRYRESLTLQPNNPAASYNLGILKYFRFEEQANEEAVDCFRAALRCRHALLRGQAHSGLANALTQRYHRFNRQERTNLEEAVQHAREGLALSGGAAMAHAALAFTCHQSWLACDSTGPESGEWLRRAERHYRSAVAKSPGYYVALNNLGNLLLCHAERMPPGPERTRALRRSIESCERAIRAEPAFHMPYDNVANALRELGEFDRAGASLQVALGYRPDYGEARNDLAILHLSVGWDGFDPARAIRLHHEAVETVAAEPKRREKLCTSFRQRLEEAAARPDRPEPGLLGEGPVPGSEIGCECLEHVMKHRLLTGILDPLPPIPFGKTAEEPRG